MQPWVFKTKSQWPGMSMSCASDTKVCYETNKNLFRARNNMEEEKLLAHLMLRVLKTCWIIWGTGMRTTIVYILYNLFPSLEAERLRG